MDEKPPGARPDESSPPEPPESVWPKKVRKAAGDLRCAGLDPVVQQAGPDWRVCVVGDHVWMTLRFAYKQGKVRDAGTELLVDGEEQTPVGSPGELMLLWAKHETDASPEQVLFPVRPMDKNLVPRGIRYVAVIMRGKGIEPGFGYSDGLWYAGFDFPGGGLRFVFERGRSGRWESYQHAPVMLVVDGEDKTAEICGNIAMAMSMAMSASSADGTSAVGASAGHGSGPGSRSGTVLRL